MVFACAFIHSIILTLLLGCLVAAQQCLIPWVIPKKAPRGLERITPHWRGLSSVSNCANVRAAFCVVDDPGLRHHQKKKAAFAFSVKIPAEVLMRFLM